MSDVTIPEGYKQTKLGPIPVTWEVKRLGDCLVQSPQYGINASAVPYQNNLPKYIRITDISVDGYFLTDKLSSVDDPSSSNFKLEQGDIVIARTGASVGKSYMYRQEDGTLIFAGFLIKFSPLKSILDPTYLFYSLRTESYWRWVEVNSVRTGQPGINSQEYSRFTIPLPPLAEQQQIADILTSVDEAIQAREAVLGQTKVVKKGLLQDLLTKGIGHTEFKDSKLGPIPVTWEVKRLGEVCNFMSYGFTNPMPTTNKGPWLLTAKDIVDGQINYQTARHTTREAFETLITDKSRPKFNDILITKDGTLGRIAIVDKENICINQSVAVLRPTISSKFLAFLLQAPKWQKMMKDDAGGSTIKHIYITKLAKMLIVVPPVEEQKKITSMIVSINESIEINQNLYQQLKQTKAGLLQDLLTGKVRVTV